jgi:hypothetical protein
VARRAGGRRLYDYEEASSRFFLNPEQTLVFADEDSPAFMAGAFEALSALWLDEGKVSEAFRSGKGLGWHEHSTCLFRGTERFFRPGYNANLIGAWLPALDGVVEKLERGAAFAEARGLVSLIKDSAAAAPIVTHRLRNGISVLEGSGGNIAVLAGPDGKVLVDARKRKRLSAIMVTFAPGARNVGQ